MEMNGSHLIPADRQTVWEALNNPDVLRACIPGCNELVMSSPTEMAATVVTKIGPVKATFKGEVTLEIESDGRCYKGVGVSTDTVEATILAMLNVVNIIAMQDAADQTRVSPYSA